MFTSGITGDSTNGQAKNTVTYCHYKIQTNQRYVGSLVTRDLKEFR